MVETVGDEIVMSLPLILVIVVPDGIPVEDTTVCPTIRPTIFASVIVLVASAAADGAIIVAAVPRFTPALLYVP